MGELESLLAAMKSSGELPLLFLSDGFMIIEMSPRRLYAFLLWMWLVAGTAEADSLIWKTNLHQGAIVDCAVSGRLVVTLCMIQPLVFPVTLSPVLLNATNGSVLQKLPLNAGTSEGTVPM